MPSQARAIFLFTKSYAWYVETILVFLIVFVVKIVQVLYIELLSAEFTVIT
jgi:hypothetical protein